MDNKEQRYIKKRKIKAFMQSIPYYMCKIFPVKKNKIVVWTFEGIGGYADSPKYIIEEILKRNKLGICNFEIVWLVNNLGKEFPDGIKEVKNTLWSRAFHMSTAAFWISNTRTFYGTKKRKKTTYVQTWHSIYGIKPIGKYRGDKLPEIAKICSKADSEMIDYLLCGNEKRYIELPDCLFYSGKIIRTGIPRVDILLRHTSEMHNKYRKTYNIPQDANILLYAPTFRGGSQTTDRSVSNNIYTLDFEAVIQILEQKFGGDWYIFLRLHPQVSNVMKEMPVKRYSEKVIDVSQLPDMAEILAASDALISDYSSSVFEAAIMKQLVFLYIEDEEEYVKERGTLRFKLEDLPFPVAKNQNELIEAISHFEREKYEIGVDKLLKYEIGVFDDGYASERVADLICDGKVSQII